MPLVDYNFGNERSIFITKLQDYILRKNIEILPNTAKENDMYKAQLKEYLSRAETLNQEFSERYALTGPENPLPFFAVNQDILLYMFTFTFLFLVLTTTVYVSRLSESTAKGLFTIPLGVIVYLLMLGFIVQFG